MSDLSQLTKPDIGPVSSPERSEMAYVGLLLTNAVSALRRGDVDHAMEQLQEAREIHADIMERE